ncbi:MAG: hypothetical protein ACHREM_33965 [Polyangiales bacterium]
MATSAASSTRPAASHAASQALLAHAIEPGIPGSKSPARAIDAVVAGVLAIAAREPGVLLGAGVLMIGGVGEGRVVIDGRARQPGLGAPRPRGWKSQDDIPAAARVSVPALPGALVLAHAGRGELTLSELSKLAIASASMEGELDPAREKSIRAFGREGALALRTGSLRAAMLRASPRSLGGVLTEADLDAASWARVDAAESKVGEASVAYVPWAESLARAIAGEASLEDDAVDHAIVAAADVHGGVAIAIVAVPRDGVTLDDTGLTAATFAEPVRRNETRVAPGAALHFASPIALLRTKAEDGLSTFAIGVTDTATADATLARLFARLADGHVFVDGSLGVQATIAGVIVDPAGRARGIAARR